MIYRLLQDKIVQSAQQMPVITITGPRQSGKTTLSRYIFPNYTYINLELPNNRNFAIDDPQGFFKLYTGNLILDEVQRAPSLLSYIQGIVDERKQNGQFILTESENLLLSEKVNQSLAGRTSIFTLLPLSLEELSKLPSSNTNYLPYLYQGFYPRLYTDPVIATEWLGDYIQTYLERDIRQLINIKYLTQFQTFLKLCAGHVGQIINYTSFSKAVGVSDKTIREWLSILEATYIVYILPPYHNNFKKRLIKSPKLYFYDTGLACTLLGISEPNILALHPLKGSLFENFIITELMKMYLNRRLRTQFYFWRENNGLEVDCLIEYKGRLFPIEIKSTQTFTSFPTGNLKKLTELIGNNIAEPYIIYGGEHDYNNQGIKVLSWKNLNVLI